MYAAYRKRPEAIALFEQVREKRVMVLGSRHPATLVTLHELAMTYQAAGELDRALPLHQQAAAGVESLRFEHSSAADIVQFLARCHEKLKQYDQAEIWRRKWLAAVKEKAGPNSAAYALELSGLGANLFQQKRYADAEPILRESLTLLENQPPEARETFPSPSVTGTPARPRDPDAWERTWETFHTQSLLGAALLGQQKYSEAEPLLVQGYQGMKKAYEDLGPHSQGFSNRQPRIETLESLVQLFEATNQPDEAAKWRKELEKMIAQPQPQ
jgi:tetratricopeptide (TPR) repeat protein